MKSWVWQYFVKATDGQSATCDLCDIVLRTYNSTSTLIEHLKKVHSLTPPQKNAKQQRVQRVLIFNFQSEILYVFMYTKYNT